MFFPKFMEVAGFGPFRRERRRHRVEILLCREDSPSACAGNLVHGYRKQGVSAPPGQRLRRYLDVKRTACLQAAIQSEARVYRLTRFGARGNAFTN